MNGFHDNWTIQFHSLFSPHPLLTWHNFCLSKWCSGLFAFAAKFAVVMVRFPGTFIGFWIDSEDLRNFNLFIHLEASITLVTVRVVRRPVWSSSWKSALIASDEPILQGKTYILVLSALIKVYSGEVPNETILRRQSDDCLLKSKWRMLNKWIQSSRTFIGVGIEEVLTQVEKGSDGKEWILFDEQKYFSNFINYRSYMV